MKLMKTIEFRDGISIKFGMPDSATEEAEMFRLRYKVYVEEKKYIPSAPNGVDIDEHDRQKTCRYFVAVINGVMVGTVRIILENPLPSERDYFSFKTPLAIHSLGPNERAEIGRIISRPYETAGIRVSRHLIITGLFSVLADYGIENHLLGGYGSIKKSAFSKLLKLGVPLHEITEKTLIYDPVKSHDPLSNFFSSDDPVVPLYFLTPEVKKYFDFLFNKSPMFKTIGPSQYRYNDSLSFLNKLLIRFRIIFLRYAS